MNGKLLIVDDEPQVRSALRARLGQLGCDILEAESVEQAKRLIQQRGYELDVVILDLRLVAAYEEEGEESGLNLLRDHLLQLQIAHICRFCERPRYAPCIVVLTAYPSVASCRAAFLAGATEYVDKNAPNVWRSLPEIVARSLQQPRADSRFWARAWVECKFQELVERYPGKFLAVMREESFLEADSWDELMQTLANEGVKPEDCLLVAIS